MASHFSSASSLVNDLREGSRIKALVELAHRGRGSSYDRYSSYSSGGYRGGLSRYSDYRVLVIGLLSATAWQDLRITCVKPGMFSFLKFAAIEMLGSLLCMGREERTSIFF
ncbi:Hypothetical predicted protein [Olea europaea subsp. europaea]|uniref:Uncharacterized protein n=1 Tax=Olea europaea subsp. europaea TaxID=158383 RepID=A0A8S0T453_OLEEU|nr:Hypothetical predicted protein [Olea europaea subsp. europaea]